MKSLQLTFLFFLLTTSQIIGQSQTSPKSGFLFGFSVGVSSLNLTLSDNLFERSIGLSLPNLKVGKMISDKMALLLYLPGSIYEHGFFIQKQYLRVNQFILTLAQCIQTLPIIC